MTPRVRLIAAGAVAVAVVVVVAWPSDDEPPVAPPPVAVAPAPVPGAPPPRTTPLEPSPDEEAPDYEEPPTPPAPATDLALFRLNAAQYDRAARDLLGILDSPTRDFPRDDQAYGFDHIGEVLRVTPLLLEKYERAADRLAAAAWRRLESRTSGGACAVKRDAACARFLLADLTRLAWRRTPAAEELDDVVGVAKDALAAGDPFDSAMRAALTTVFLSPWFLFRVELPQKGDPSRLGGPELAARLATFLWSSAPDAALLDDAEKGRLATPKGLETAVRRMLEDPRSAALAEQFAGQWLSTRSIEDAFLMENQLHGPSPFLEEQRPAVARVRKALREQVERYFRVFLDEDRSALELVDADFTFLDADLSAFYAQPTTGPGLQRVHVAQDARRGLLGLPAMLLMTSNPERTSPTKRGRWVLSQLLCEAPKPPPPGADVLPKVEGQLSMREQIEAHSKKKSCAGCHAGIDPLGFALENFDQAGDWRTLDHGRPIDSRGVLPDGRVIDGVSGLRAFLRDDPRFASCLVRQMLTYALARGLGDDDKRTVERLSKSFAEKGHRLRELVLLVATSEPFLRRSAGGAR